MFYIFFAFLLTLFVLRELWMRHKYDLHRIPTPPTTRFLGHSLYLKNATKSNFIIVWIQEWHKKLGYPKLMLLRFLGDAVIVLMDMNLVREVICSSDKLIPRGERALVKFRRLVSGNDPQPSIIGIAETTPYVKAIRRAHLTSFSTIGLKQILQKQKSVMLKLIDQIEKERSVDRDQIHDQNPNHDGSINHDRMIDTNQTFEKRRLIDDDRIVENHRSIDYDHSNRAIDVQDLSVRAAIDHIGKVGLDLDLGGLDGTSPLYHLLVRCAQHADFQSPTPIGRIKMLIPFLESTKKIKRDFKGLFKKWNEVASEIMSRDEPEEDNLSFWASLRRVRLPETNLVLPFYLIRSEIATAIIGGTDTTGHQLGWILALLATHEEIVERIMKELRSHGLTGDDQSKELQFEDLAELEYLGAVVKEGMRLIHVTPFVSGKIAHRDLVIDRYRVPKGTRVAIPGGVIMNNETQWEDHMNFKPERWLDGKDHSNSYYVPFSIGSRNCVGGRLATQFLKLAIMYLVQKYKFELIGETIEEMMSDMDTGLVFGSKNGIKMKFHPRS
eukprot:g8395.t1